LKNSQKVNERIMMSFLKSVTDVYSDLIGENIKTSGLEKLAKNFVVIDGVSTIVPFTGKFSGRMLLAMDKKMAIKIHNILTEENVRELTDDVLFTVAEIGNMVAGNAVTKINNEIEGRIRLAPPNVFSGNNMSFINFKVNIYNVLFETPNGSIKLNVAFKEELE